MKTYKVAGVYLYPLCDVSTKTIYGFNTEDTPFTPFGRQRLEHKSLQSLVYQELRKLMESKILNRMVEYLDNRISRYSMKLSGLLRFFMYLIDMYGYKSHELSRV